MTRSAITSPETSPAETGPHPAGDVRQTQNPKATLFVTVLGLVAVVCASIASIMFGARDVALDEVIDGLFGHHSSIGAAAVAERLPRTATALVVGAALAISGTLMQAVTRNPIADPGILGVNSGAALFIVLGMSTFGLSTVREYTWLALGGGLVTALCVFTVGALGPGGPTPVKLALAGVATTVALTSLTTALLLPQTRTLDVFRQWQVGSVARGDFTALLAIAPLLIIGLVVALTICTPLNTMALGDELATALGTRVQLTRVVGIIAAVALASAATAVAGPIGFVGLMVPHAVRMLTSPDLRTLLPLSALYGATLLTVADVLGRILARPGEIEVGVLTAVVGAPLLIFITRRTKLREL